MQDSQAGLSTQSELHYRRPFRLASIWIRRAAFGLILLLLLFSVLAGTGENLHARMLQLGTALWDNYVVLRADLPRPTCDADFNPQERLQQLEQEFAGSHSDEDLFAETFDRESTRQSLENQRAVCQSSHAAYKLNQTRVDVFVRIFRTVEQGLASLSLFAISQQHLVLMLLLLLAAVMATVQQHHIAFRAIITQSDHYVSVTAQMLAAVCLLLSALAFYQGGQASGIEVQRPELIVILVTGSAVLLLINLWQLVFSKPALVGRGNPLQALLAIPIYCYMLLGASCHFMLVEGHAAGVAIYFTQLFQMSGLYLSIALYIWVGMLLKQTQLGAKLFAVFVPWRLPPELLAFVMIALMAVPTAYTGASGIIIIAMGATVYQELRRIGTRRQLALAVTAMTGSSGVVLRPCLLIVGIAMLNKEVVTDELFYWGLRVFLLSQVIFLGYALLVKTGPLFAAQGGRAWQDCFRRLPPLLPYVVLTALIAVFYAGVLDAHLDEFSAPIILPVLVLAYLWYERRTRHGRQHQVGVFTADASPGAAETMEHSNSLRRALGQSVSGAGVQIGALLMLMGCSFTVGGILEHGAGSSGLPEAFSSPLVAMLWLTLFLIVIGMLMDPFGALILVSGTLAPVAYSNGIDPVHFWMTCLVAFELGYLTPPVALNHLLTRQVVGAEEVALAAKEGSNFYYRHERILLPLLVMTTTLAVVAFGPLLLAL
jgi:TRAP-type C4-dicarboxylate transport system permease large subunit